MISVCRIDDFIEQLIMTVDNILIKARGYVFYIKRFTFLPYLICQSFIFLFH